MGGGTSASTSSSGSAGGGTSASLSSSSSVGGGTSASASSGTGGGAPEALVHYIGRFDTTDPAGPRFSWPGSAIAARFSGTGLNVKIHDEGNDEFTVVIDGGAPQVLSTSWMNDSYVLASGLSPGEHDLWLEKRTESYVGLAHFLGLEPQGALVPSPEPFSRRIEMIGDSITCGYGDIGMGPGCGFSAQTEDESQAYGAFAGRALSAAHTSICYSGMGVYRNNMGSTTDQMPVRFGRTLADDATSTWDFSWVPDVVVVNLGTNDFYTGDPGQPYVDAYTAFAQQIRARYPQAFLFLAVGTMLSDEYPAGAMHYTLAQQYTQAVVSARRSAGDARISYVDLGVQDGTADGLGCDWHPSVTTQQKMADTLVAAIKLAMGW